MAKMEVKSMKMTDLITLVDTSPRLRDQNEEIVIEYADKMRNGIKFNAAIVGQYPEGDKQIPILIDGWHRILAARAIGLESFQTTHRAYQSKTHALIDQLKENLHVGYRVLPGDRDRRIKLLSSLDVTGKELSKMMSLSESSISRIIKGDQTEGKPGPKAATEKGPRPPKGTPRQAVILGSKKFYNSIQDIGLTSINKESHQDLLVSAKKFSEKDYKLLLSCLESASNIVTKIKEKYTKVTL